MEALYPGNITNGLLLSPTDRPADRPPQSPSLFGTGWGGIQTSGDMFIPYLILVPDSSPARLLLRMDFIWNKDVTNARLTARPTFGRRKTSLHPPLLGRCFNFVTRNNNKRRFGRRAARGGAKCAYHFAAGQRRRRHFRRSEGLSGHEQRARARAGRGGRMKEAGCDFCAHNFIPCISTINIQWS